MIDLPETLVIRMLLVFYHIEPSASLYRVHNSLSVSPTMSLMEFRSLETIFKLILILFSHLRYVLIFLSLSLFLPHSCCSPLWSIGHPWNSLFHFSFLILRQSVGLLERGISQSQGRYLHRTKQTQSKRRQTSMPWVRFEPTISVFERAKTVHALDQWFSTFVRPQAGKFFFTRPGPCIIGGMARYQAAARRLRNTA
jgi:hypothetical protein